MSGERTTQTDRKIRASERAFSLADVCLSVCAVICIELITCSKGTSQEGLGVWGKLVAHKNHQKCPFVSLRTPEMHPSTGALRLDEQYKVF